MGIGWPRLMPKYSLGTSQALSSWANTTFCSGVPPPPPYWRGRVMAAKPCSAFSFCHALPRATSSCSVRPLRASPE
jgi:hypothetical protein